MSKYMCQIFNLPAPRTEMLFCKKYQHKEFTHQSTQKCEDNHFFYFIQTEISIVSELTVSVPVKRYVTHNTFTPT